MMVPFLKCPVKFRTPLLSAWAIKRYFLGYRVEPTGRGVFLEGDMQASSNSIWQSTQRFIATFRKTPQPRAMDAKVIFITTLQSQSNQRFTAKKGAKLETLRSI
jgi:hypothetical protein